MGMWLKVSLFCYLLGLVPFARCDVTPFHKSAKYQFGGLGPYPRQSFFSDPDVVAPIPNIIVEPQPGVSTNSLVTWAAHADNVKPRGPQLLDASSLSLVFQGPLYGDRSDDTFGITLETCNGTNYLVYWAGSNVQSRAAGDYYIFNSTYHLVWKVSSVGLWKADAHDGYLTADCHIIFTTYEPEVQDLQAFGRSADSWIMQSYFQEIDLATNELIFQWRASDHIDLRDGLWPPDFEDQGYSADRPWDFFHLNSIEKDVTGNYLISARHTNALYYINGTDGTIIWTLGGPRNDFLDLSGGSATDFAWQHEAQWIDDERTMISLFDDRASDYSRQTDPVSRGIILALDYDNMTVRLEASYRAPDNIVATRKGGMQVLENGNVLLGFGSEPAFTEYSPNGSILWDVRLGPVMANIDRATADNYRSYKVNWIGTPYWRPKIVAGPSQNGVPVALVGELDSGTINSGTKDTVYFSWNGATQLRRWLVLASNSTVNLTRIDHVWQHVAKDGFESAIFIGDSMRYVQVIAIGDDGELLDNGASDIVDMSTGESIPFSSIPTSYPSTDPTSSLLDEPQSPNGKQSAEGAAEIDAQADALASSMFAALQEAYLMQRIERARSTTLSIYLFAAMLVCIILGVISGFYWTNICAFIFKSWDASRGNYTSIQNMEDAELEEGEMAKLRPSPPIGPSLDDHLESQPTRRRTSSLGGLTSP